MTTLKSTFVPGGKTLFYDDFTDMAAGDAPPHFKVRGGAPELQAAGEIRQLKITKNGTLTPNLTSLPKNFTYEAEMVFETKTREATNLILWAGNKQVLQFYTSVMATTADMTVSLRSPYQELGRIRVNANWAQPAKIALWVQDGRLRAFLNGENLLDFNQVEMPAIDKVELDHGLNGANQYMAYRSVRFAESTPDFSKVIASSGRFIAHGILFDTASDRLKPESAPAIQSIAKGLEINPNLRLLIEGHTDSAGNAAANLDLSRRRAEAVKVVLVAQFKVDAARLTTAGLGSTKPIDSNDTPQGRAQNRRVELVKK
jgi:outer membrane protein OmpA-like peptidoglycan-associated protein